jgi:hypothetical protein
MIVDCIALEAISTMKALSQGLFSYEDVWVCESGNRNGNENCKRHFQERLLSCVPSAANLHSRLAHMTGESVE